MRVTIRQMESRDINEVYEIEKESFSIPWSYEALKKEVEENLLALYIVAEIDEKVVGYLGMWKIMDEAHITNIAVKKDYRGQGIGDYLMMAIIDYCEKHNIPNITLEVRKSNQVAINLYKKHGFVECGIRPKYYTDENEDALIMWRRK
jgi:ribosomal-protein-alanine N-acetyltransferase